MADLRALVVGATGMLGEPVARRLLADGWRVRCLSRDPARARAQLGDGFEFTAGDVTRPESLDAAFDGCSHLHLNLRGGNTIVSYEVNEVQGARHCLAAARRHGFALVSYLSGAGRSDPVVQRHFVVRIKRAVEEALAMSDLPWIAWRATHFMESLPQFVRDGRAAVLGRQPHALHYVAAADYARMVSRAFAEPSSHSRALTVFGPEALTMRTALQFYVAARHPELNVSTLPLPMARLIAYLRGDADLRFAAELFDAFRDIGETGDPREANELLGAPQTTLQQWLAAGAR